MADSLNALEDWASPLLQRLSAASRTRLARALAQQLRRSQQQRMLGQRNPDNTPYAPRKQRGLRAKQGRIKRKGLMFKKLRTARYLKAKGDPSGITVGFTGRIARIARVHQYGLKDSAERGARSVKYARREPLGLTVQDLELIRDGLLQHLLDGGT